MEEKLVLIINEMTDYLSVTQLKKLQEVLISALVEGEAQKQSISNDEYLNLFLDAKKIEGFACLIAHTLRYRRSLMPTSTPSSALCMSNHPA